MLSRMYLYVGDISEIPMDFNTAAQNGVEFSSRTININQGFVEFRGTVCELIVPIIS